MESQFESLDLKEIASITKICLEKGLRFNEPFLQNNYDILYSVSKLFGNSQIDSFDVEYICAFTLENYHLLQNWIDKNNSYDSISGKLRKPKLKKFQVYYKVSSREFVIEYYKTDWDSFNKDWVEESIQETLSSGGWDYYRETPIEREVIDSDRHEFEISSVESYKDLELESVEKNIIRLLSENTEKIVGNLDRNSLIRIRKIIDSKLKSL